MPRIERYYETKYYKKHLPDERKTRRADLNIAITKQIPVGKEILVVGCSTGEDVQYLTEKNRVYGVDIMNEAVKEAQSKKILAKKANIEEEGLQYPDHFFDIVVCKDVLEHLFDPEYILMETRRVLKKDGYAVINVPNHFYIRARLKLLMGKGIIWPGHETENEWDYFHIRFFTYKGFMRLLQTTSFEVFDFVPSDTVNWPWARPVPRRLIKWFIRRLPNLFSGNFYVKVRPVWEMSDVSNNKLY